MKESTKKELEYTTIFILLVISITGLVYYNNMHETMMHNVDLIYNAVKNPELLNRYVDEYAPNKYVSFTHLYINSMTMLRKDNWKTIFFAFGIGLSIGGLIYKKEQTINYEEDERNNQRESKQTNKRRASKSSNRKR